MKKIILRDGNFRDVKVGSLIKVYMEYEKKEQLFITTGKIRKLPPRGRFKYSVCFLEIESCSTSIFLENYEEIKIYE